MNIQDVFLNQARKDKTPLVIYLINGFQLRGVVKGFDSYIVSVTDTDNRQNIVYKHAISTIIPSRYVPIMDKEDDKAEENEE